MQKTIGLYDSGVGGLTVLAEMRRAFPNQKFIYFADTLHLPYGDKTKKEILQYSRRILKWMVNEMNVALAISACNTSSALALEEISGEFDVPIIGTIKPILPHIIHNSKIKKIGVIATQATVDSRIHEKMIRECGFTGDIFSIACPELTPLIEDGDLNSNILVKVVNRYLEIFKKEAIDTLIFGCTHYPFIKHIIEDFLPKGTIYIDPAEYIAIEARKYIATESYTVKNNSDILFFTSGFPDIFDNKVFNLTKIITNSIHQKLIFEE